MNAIGVAPPAARARRAQRRLVAGDQQDVDLARDELAIDSFVGVDARRLDELEGEIAALLIAELGHPLLERHVMRRTARQDAGVADAQHFRRLRTRHQRPCGRTAEQRNEFAPVHSITSSASNCIAFGTARPSALAVFRLITSSNLVGCTTGRSAGRAPLRIRPA